MLKLIPNVDEIKILSDEAYNYEHITLGANLMSENVEKDFYDFCNMPMGEENILFAIDDNMVHEEYSISIGEKITVSSADMAGQIYALQTLKQITMQCKNHLPNIEIHDKPTYGVRGFMLDVGRYFFPVDDVKRIIRRMVSHKMNMLHLHLTEDQGWRIEIKKYPLLTEKGSIRSHTNYNCKPRSGYYTQDDIREIVKYAHEFGINVMPEYDIPGHSTSAIACYNDLTCFPRKTEVATHWGVKHDVLCVGKESTMGFVKDIIDEMCDLFPDEYFHIGGDEVPKHRWNICPHCQAKIQELGLADSDELQAWFMNEINDYCRQKSKQAFMWSWDVKSEKMLNTDLGYTKCGDDPCGERPFIDTSTSACYIDLPYGYISLKDSAEHRISDGNCLGIEAALWTEYVPDMKKADKMTFPRLAPISEIGWCGKSDYESIMNRMDFYHDFLDKNGYGYSTPNVADPSKLRGKAQGLWFEKRQLTWQGLTNIIKDKRAERTARMQQNPHK